MDCRQCPACKLGLLAKHGSKIQMCGGALSTVPKTYPLRPVPHKIMAIFKAPDMADAHTIGRGRNIDKFKELVNGASISTADVYVTGMVKCAPPKRNPAVQEVKACMAHLADELRIVDPEVIILFGTETLRVFNLMGEGGVNSLHGQVHTLKFPHDETLTKEYKVVVTTDPNALYMNADPKLEGTIIKDLKVAKSVVTGKLSDTTSAPTKYTLIDSLDKLDAMIATIHKRGMFAFDTESRTFPWLVEPMICASFCWGYDEAVEEPMAAVLPMYNHDPYGLDWKLRPTWKNGERAQVLLRLRDLFTSSIPKIAHNIIYDMNVIRKHVGVRINGFLFDTLLMHHLLWEYPPHDLEYLADIELGTGDYSRELHKITGYGKVLLNTYDHVPDNIMHPYTAKDVESTYRLMTRYFPRLKAKPHLWTLYQEEVHPFIRTLAKAEWYGVKLDEKIIDKLTQEFTVDQDALLIKLRSSTFPEFKPSSSEHVAKIIIDAGHLPDIADKRKAQGYSTSKTKLLALEDKMPIVKDILKYRSLTKLTSTYMRNAKDYIKHDGKARLSVMIHGTVNGRPSAKFLHQIPRVDHSRIAAGKSNLRDMFITTPDRVMVYGDYSQIELVTLAIQSGDEAMLAIFKAGEDIHKATAAAFLEVDLDKVDEFNRSIGKSINFGRVYGSVTGDSLMKLTWKDTKGVERPLTESMIKKGFDSLDERFPSASRYFEDTVNEISSNNGTYVTRFGREKRMGTSLNAASEWARREAERQAVNGSIQSPAASVTIRTLNKVDAWIEEQIEKQNWVEENGYLTITVHDSGLWDVMKKKADEFVVALKSIASREVPQLDNFQFNMKIGTGKSWSEAELNAK